MEMVAAGSSGCGGGRRIGLEAGDDGCGVVVAVGGGGERAAMVEGCEPGSRYMVGSGWKRRLWGHEGRSSGGGRWFWWRPRVCEGRREARLRWGDGNGAGGLDWLSDVGMGG